MVCLKQSRIRAPPIIEAVNIMACYLRIKQSVCVLDIFAITIQTVIRSWWKMQVHIRHAWIDKCSQEAAPNENCPHVLCQIKEPNKSKLTCAYFSILSLIAKSSCYRRMKDSAKFPVDFILYCVLLHLQNSSQWKFN